MAIDTGDTTWMLISTGLVMMMTPALGFFEAGMLRLKNSLSVIMQTFTGLALLSVLWFIVGFTLTFAP
ncbi:MAG: ammonia channel protein, partial [Candidatus Nitrosocosmicus sp.]